MMLAGEARGRSRAAPPAPTSDHRKRLNSLLPWADYHGHNLVMTWTYLTADGVTVDWFAEDGGLPDLMDQVGVRMPQDRPYANLVAPPDYVEPPFGTTADRPPEQRMFDHTDRAEIVAQAQRTVARVERRLFATAPTAVAPIRVAGRGTRGRWVPFDLFGASTGSLLLGVLDEPMSLRDGQDVARRIRNLIRDETDVSATAPGQLPPDLPMTVSVRGRLIAAVAGPGLIEPWNLLDVG
jgi:hypothetical protein